MKDRIVPINEKMRKISLKSFDHVERKVINAPMRKRDLIQVKRMEKGRVKPKIKLVELVKMDMSIKEATMNMTSNSIG